MRVAEKLDIRGRRSYPGVFKISPFAALVGCRRDLKEQETKKLDSLSLFSHEERVSSKR